MGPEDQTKGSRPAGRREVYSIVLFAGLIVAALVGLGWRCVDLQYRKAERYRDECIRIQRSLRPQTAQRGAILDVHGYVLAASNRTYTVFADPRDIKDPKETSVQLGEILDMGAHEICRLITESGNPRFVKIKEDVEADVCEQAGRLIGVGVQSEWERHYPVGRLAGHVVGFTSTDGRGLGGIEFEYDEPLRGEPARSTYLVDVHRRPVSALWQETQTNSSAKDGKGIILTLDATIQQFARAELIKRYEEFEAESALAIVVNPKTGAILAMVSLPDFDPAGARTADPNTFCNHAITDQFEPGSIMKPITMAIALDAKVVSLNETIFCENGNYRGKGFGQIGEYRQGYGDLSARGILVKSSNIGMAKIGQRLGTKRLREGLEFFGFDDKVDIELSGEAEGQLRPLSEWNGYSVTRIPFGQEISTGALQIVRAFCILAGSGRVVRLHLVKAVVEPDGSVVETDQSASDVGYVVKAEVADWIVKEALAGVVNEGTGWRAKLDGWQVFGKTGTGQIAKRDGTGYEEGAYVASFIGGAPADDPQVMALVSIRRPNIKLGKGYTGGVVSSPVVKVILEKTLEYLGVPKRTDAAASAQF